MPDCIRTTTGFPVSGGRLYGVPRVVSGGLVESRAENSAKPSDAVMGPYRHRRASHQPPRGPSGRWDAKVDWYRGAAMGPMGGPSLALRTPKRCKGPVGAQGAVTGEPLGSPPHRQKDFSQYVAA
jgi:hypothetical protein